MSRIIEPSGKGKGLYEAFAKCTASDYEAAVVVLNCSGKYLACAGRVLVYHDYDAFDVVVFKSFGDIKYSVGDGVAAGGYDAVTGFEKLRCHAVGCAEVASTVVFEVDYEIAHALLFKFFDGFVNFVGCGLGKACHADVSGRGVGHVYGVDAVHGYVVTDKVEVDKVVAAFDFEFYVAAFFAAKGFKYFAVNHFGVGKYGIVYVDNTVAWTDAGTFGRASDCGLDNVDGVFDD